MTVRNDIDVEWWRSPRIIMVEAPSTTISIQDLVDTLRSIEDELINLDDQSLLDASGKEPLGENLKVGITVKLNNAQLAFERRLSSVHTATATNITQYDDLPGQILEDTNAHFLSYGLKAGDSVVNITDGSCADIIDVINDTRLRHYPLVDGTFTEWDIGDTYKLFPIFLCTVTGGNLVAIDVDGNAINPIVPSAYVSASKESATSVAMVTTGSGVTQQDKVDITTMVGSDLAAEHGEGSWEGGDVSAIAANVELIKAKTDTMDWADVEFIKQFAGGRWKIMENQMIFYSDNNYEIMRFNLFDENGNPTMANVFERVRV